MEIKEHLRNPNFYFVLGPLVAGLAMLTQAAVVLPRAATEWRDQQEEFKATEARIAQILIYAPERLDYKPGKTTDRDFDYANIINAYAKRHSIPPSVYRVSSKPGTSGKEKTQRAEMTIDNINIERLSAFLSDLLAQWPGLTCDTLTLTKLKTGKDNWNAFMKFTYDFGSTG